MNKLTFGNKDDILKVRNFENKIAKETDGKLREYNFDCTLDGCGRIIIKAHSKSEAIEMLEDMSVDELITEFDDYDFDHTLSSVDDIEDNNNEAKQPGDIPLFDTVEVP